MKYQDYKRHALGEHRSPRAIEADVYAIRSEIIDTVTRLEDRFSPRKMVEQMLHGSKRAGEGGSAFMGNLGTTVRDNPISALMLVGGAVALLGRERNAARQRALGTIPKGALRAEVEAMSHALAGSPHAGTRERVRERGEQLRSNIATKGAELRDRGSDLRVRAQDARDRARGRAQDAREYARTRAHDAREYAVTRARDARDFGNRTIQEEPLLLAAIGLGIGAVLGASPWFTERKPQGLPRGVGSSPEPLGPDPLLLAEAEAERTSVSLPTPSEEELRAAQVVIIEDESDSPLIEEESESAFNEPLAPLDPDPGPPGPGGRSRP